MRAGYVPQEEVAKYRPRGVRRAPQRLSSRLRCALTCAWATAGARRSSWARARCSTHSATCLATRASGEGGGEA